MNKTLVGLVFMAFLAGCSGCASGPKRAERLGAMFAQLRTEQDQKLFDETLNQIKIQVPTTPEEVRVIAQEMEGPLFAQAQEMMSKINDKALIPVLLEVFADKVKKIQNWSNDDFKAMGETNGKDAQRRLGNVEVLVMAFGEMRDPRAISALKEASRIDVLKYQATTALGRIGDEGTLDELMQRADKEKDINVAAFGDKALMRIVKEINDPATTPNRRGALINQIPASTKPEAVAVIKDLALNNPDKKVRDQAGLVLVNSMSLNPKIVDPEFIAKWVESVEGVNQSWAIYGMEKNWDARYVPILRKILLNGASFSARANAARVLGEFKVQEAIPDLEKALLDDDSGVRGKVRTALIEMLGLEEFRHRYFKIEFIHSDDLSEDIKRKLEQNK